MTDSKPISWRKQLARQQQQQLDTKYPHQFVFSFEDGMGPYGPGFINDDQFAYMMEWCQLHAGAKNDTWCTMGDTMGFGVTFRFSSSPTAALFKLTFVGT